MHKVLLCTYVVCDVIWKLQSFCTTILYTFAASCTMLCALINLSCYYVIVCLFIAHRVLVYGNWPYCRSRPRLCRSVVIFGIVIYIRLQTIGKMIQLSANKVAQSSAGLTNHSFYWHIAVSVAVILEAYPLLWLVALFWTHLVPHSIFRQSYTRSDYWLHIAENGMVLINIKLFCH